MLAEQKRIHCRCAYDPPFPMDTTRPHIPALSPERTDMQQWERRTMTGRRRLIEHTEQTLLSPCRGLRAS